MSEDTDEAPPADDTGDEDMRKALSGLQKARAPETFAQDVTSTIHKRSAGAFFGRRTLGDRVPFGALAIAAVLVLLVIGYLMWARPAGVHEPTPVPHGSGLDLRP